MRIYARQKIFSNLYYEVYNNGVEFANGMNGNYLTLKNKYGGVVAVTKYQDRFLLIDIERIFVGGRRLEFVRGFKKDYETPIQAAIREVKEEINCEVKDVQYLGKVEPDSGIIENNIDVVLLNISHLEQVQPNQNEDIRRVVILSQQELLDKIKQQEIIDSYTLSAFMLYLTKFLN